MSKHFLFSGVVALAGVNVFDHSVKCHIAGQAGGFDELNLYHFGNSRNILLNIKGMNFDGYDHDSQKHFNGSVNDGNVLMYDYETGQYYNFLV